MPSWGRVVACLVLMIPPTCLLFGPIGEFHYMITFGLFGYMGWNGEDPNPNGFYIDGYEVVIFPGRLLATVVVWFICLAAVAVFIRSFENVVRAIKSMKRSSADTGGPGNR